MTVLSIAGAATAAPAVAEREFPTPEQMERLRILMRDRPGQRVQMQPRPFDLPRDYLLCVFGDPHSSSGFVCGIDPDGRASS